MNDSISLTFVGWDRHEFPTYMDESGSFWKDTNPIKATMGVFKYAPDFYSDPEEKQIKQRVTFNPCRRTW